MVFRRVLIVVIGAVLAGDLRALAEGAVADFGHPQRLLVPVFLDHLAHFADVVIDLLDRFRAPGLVVVVHVDDIDQRAQAVVAKHLGDKLFAVGDSAKHHARFRIGLFDGAGADPDHLGKLVARPLPVDPDIGLIPEFPGFDVLFITGHQRLHKIAKALRFHWRIIPEPVLVFRLARIPARNVADVRDQREVVFFDGHPDKIIPEEPIIGPLDRFDGIPAKRDAQQIDAGALEELKILADAFEGGRLLRVIFTKTDRHMVVLGRGGPNQAVVPRVGSIATGQQDHAAKDYHQQGDYLFHVAILPLINQN